MSREHVDEMNRLLAATPEITTACAELPEPYVIQYTLTDGRDGGTEYWTLAFRRDGLRFGLDPVDSPDLSYSGDWASEVDATRRFRAGEEVESPTKVAGDLDGFKGRPAEILELARSIATLPCEWPDRPH